MVQPEDLQEEARALAARLAAGPSRAYEVVKDGLRRGMDSTLQCATPAHPTQ